MPQRNSSLDAVKGFTILLVMLGHVLVLNEINDPYVYDGIKAVQMPLFMMVSGYLCGRSAKVGNIRDYGRMVGRRALGYMLPFFAWTLVFHLDDFTWAFPAYLEQPERGMWFLVTLFVLTVMAYTAQLAAAWAGRLWGKLAVRRAGEPGGKAAGAGTERLGGKAAEAGGRSKKAAAAAAFWGCYGLLALLVLLQLRAGIPWLGPHLTRIYIPYYMAAYVFGSQEMIIFRYVNRKLRYGLAAAGGVLCLAVVVREDLMVMESTWDYLLQTAASFGGCAAVFAAFYGMGDNPAKRFFAWLGRYTLEIYSIHYHFARLLNPGVLTFAVYSPRWFLFVGESFLLMAGLTALVVLAGKFLPAVNYVLYGKKDSIWAWLRRRRAGGR